LRRPGVCADTIRAGAMWGNQPAAAYIPPGKMSQETIAVPPVEDVLSEVVVTLAFAAAAYLEPPEQGTQPDLVAAGIAIDAAGSAFERISPRLRPEQRTALSGILADVRMTFVRKRGL
jgi:hypothetical protein